MTELFHGGPSGHSASVLAFLAEKGLELEEERVDLAAFGQFRPEFLALNPAGQVPVLRDGDRTLTEAFFVMLYLNERYPGPELDGADARARYLVQKWGKYVETHLAPNVAIVGWASAPRTLGDVARAGLADLSPERRALWQRAADGFSAEEVASARAALMKGMGRIAADLARHRWLAGETYSIADIAVFPHAARASALGIETPSRVAEWLAEVAARPAVRRALGQTGGPEELATMGPEPGRWG